MDRDPQADARDFVLDRWPHARWAILTGSVVTAHRTAGSDLDIVVVLPDGDPDAPHRDSCFWRGWPVEVFVHDAATLEHYLAKDASSRRPIMQRMVANGVVLIDDLAAEQARERCRQVLISGPEPVSTDALDYQRYTLTSLLDDLVHAHDPDERSVTAAILWTQTAEFLLASNRHWLGTGKWLLRELRDLDAGLAERWLRAKDDPGAFVEEVLTQAGGQLFDGYRVAGGRPSVTAAAPAETAPTTRQEPADLRTPP